MEELVASITGLAQEALKAGLGSGMAIGLVFAPEGQKEQQLYFGHLAEQQQEVGPSSFFDLASLTKPLATSLSCLAMIGQGQLSLAMTLPQLLPACQVPEDKRQITLAHLLSHRSGLPAHRPYYLELVKLSPRHRGRALLNLVLAEALVAGVGGQELYSDLGFMLLAEVVRYHSGQDLAEFSRKSVFAPLGLEDEIFFAAHQTRERAWVATEFCPWRQKLVQGEVHDQNCWAMGGVCGQAGLFASLPGLLRLLRFLLQAAKDEVHLPALDNNLLRQAMTGQHGPQSWGLGFDTPDQKKSSAGTLISADSCGHLGYTGTSFWLDFPRKMGVVLLTNRIYPHDDLSLIRAFRPRLHDAIFSFYR